MLVADGWREQWPSLPLEAWAETCTTLHLWMQIVGKIRLAASPWLNHGWHATLYPTATGLTTSLIPYGTWTVTAINGTAPRRGLYAGTSQVCPVAGR